MRRDMDLIRSIMLEIEDGKTCYDAISAEARHALGYAEEVGGLTREQADTLQHHLGLIEENGFVEFSRSGGGTWRVLRITSRGHDFTDAVRDPKIWQMTKEGARQAGGFSLDLLIALAKGLIKKQAEKWTGVEIDL